MLQYTLRRLAYTIPVLLGVLIVTFVLRYIAPGDPVLAVIFPTLSRVLINVVSAVKQSTWIDGLRDAMNPSPRGRTTPRPDYGADAP